MFDPLRKNEMKYQDIVDAVKKERKELAEAEKNHERISKRLEDQKKHQDDLREKIEVTTEKINDLRSAVDEMSRFFIDRLKKIQSEQMGVLTEQERIIRAVEMTPAQVTPEFNMPALPESFLGGGMAQPVYVHSHTYLDGKLISSTVSREIAQNSRAKARSRGGYR